MNVPVVDGCRLLGAGHSCCASQPWAPLPGITNAEHNQGEGEEQLCRYWCPRHCLGAEAVVERLEDSGVAQDGCDEDKHVAPWCSEAGVGSTLFLSPGDGGWES